MDITPFLIDTNLPFAAVINDWMTAANRETLQQSQLDDRVGYPGDPNVGKLFDGLLWDDLSETQKQLIVWTQAHGVPSQWKRLSDMLEEFYGAKGSGSWWNLSYAGWGLKPGSSPDSSVLKLVTVVDRRDSSIVEGFIAA